MLHTKKVVEDFVCEKCGQKVKGDGYTNHCPSCLWSKHVDDQIPGDRASYCQGLMKPIGVLVKRGEITKIEHKCQKCGYKHLSPVKKNDNRDLLIKVSVADINEI